VSPALLIAREEALVWTMARARGLSRLLGHWSPKGVEMGCWLCCLVFRVSFLSCPEYCMGALYPLLFFFLIY
jgi:hypothetical protein